MFTGIIELQGIVIANTAYEQAKRLIIKANFDDVQTGDSISVNGVCLTLLPIEDENLHFDVSPETLNVTNLGSLKVNDKVNLERAMLSNTRFGGHYVSGHVDTTATLIIKKTIGDYIELHIAGFLPHEMRYLMPKGSITIDGVSLTINTATKQDIAVMLVPHTLNNTTLGQLVPGNNVNIEFDYLTRIVAHQLDFARSQSEEDV